jgi:DNA-binding FadR family transcriptional regulator
VALAATYQNDAAMTLAETALREMTELGEGIEKFDAADVRFHLALVEASGNRAINVMMLAIRKEIGRHLRARLLSLDEPSSSLSKLTAEHAAIFAAVAEGDATTASALVREHITSFYEGAPDARRADRSST